MAIRLLLVNTSAPAKMASMYPVEKAMPPASMDITPGSALVTTV